MHNDFEKMLINELVALCQREGVLPTTEQELIEDICTMLGYDASNEILEILD